MYKYICPICNKIFETNSKGQVTCSKKCASVLRREKSLIEITCDYCGKKFKRIKNRIKQTKNYCSIECRINASKKRETRKCSYCGKDVERKKSDFKKINGHGDRKDIYCSIECMSKHYYETGKTAGENNGCWNGGKDSYKGVNWYHIRNEIRKRDEYTCQICGITEDELGMQLSVHHIIPYALFKGNDKLANQDINLISLCESCHRKVHSGDNHHSNFLNKYQDFIESYEEYCKENNI